MCLCEIPKVIISIIEEIHKKIIKVKKINFFSSILIQVFRKLKKEKEIK